MKKLLPSLLCESRRRQEQLVNLLLLENGELLNCAPEENDASKGTSFFLDLVFLSLPPSGFTGLGRCSLGV